MTPLPDACVYSPDSPFFSVRPVFDDPSLAVQRMEKLRRAWSYIVTFRPREKRDYNYTLICVTEREKFAVAVSDWYKGLLGFPDNVEMGMAPVKHTATKTFLVRNVGEKATKRLHYQRTRSMSKPRNGNLRKVPTYK